MQNFDKTKQLRGLLPIHKPVGMSSKDVSRWLVKRFGKMPLGHVGTLDPDASGVLPILIGSATRLQDYLLDSLKVYEFDVTFGYETDTLDASGKIVRQTSVPPLSRKSIEQVAAQFVGQITQTPPLYSAVKFQGRALYSYARSGSEDTVKLADLTREVDVYELKLLAFSDKTARFRVHCGKGTYVRVLAKDLAESLQTCGTVTALCRKQSAGIQLDACVTLDALENDHSWQQHVIPVELLTLGLPRLRFADRAVVNRLSLGQRVVLPTLNELDLGCGEQKLSQRGQAQRVLLQADSRYFGLGDITYLADRSVMVAMKRGL